MRSVVRDGGELEESDEWTDEGGEASDSSEALAVGDAECGVDPAGSMEEGVALLGWGSASDNVGGSVEPEVTLDIDGGGGGKVNETAEEIDGVGGVGESLAALEFEL